MNCKHKQAWSNIAGSGIWWCPDCGAMNRGGVWTEPKLKRSAVSWLERIKKFFAKHEKHKVIISELIDCKSSVWIKKERTAKLIDGQMICQHYPFRFTLLPGGRMITESREWSIYKWEPAD